jgi:hypothetical protein
MDDGHDWDRKRSCGGSHALSRPLSRNGFCLKSDWLAGGGLIRRLQDET